MRMIKTGTEQRRVSASWVLGWLLFIPGIVSAEGAARLLDCTIARVCDAAGRCEAGSGQVTFRMEPIEIGADGSGRYALSYGHSETEMRALSLAGPYVWTEGSERNTLLASSETAFLWHRLRLDPAPEATVRFLSCVVRL
jgi:hypothetical protein